MAALDDDLHEIRNARVSKRGAAVADPSAVTSAPAVAAPTKAEYDALRTDLVNTRTALAALLAVLRNSGQIS